jgi:hypothetical protein
MHALSFCWKKMDTMEILGYFSSSVYLNLNFINFVKYLNFCTKVKVLIFIQINLSTPWLHTTISCLYSCIFFGGLFFTENTRERKIKGGKSYAFIILNVLFFVPDLLLCEMQNEFIVPSCSCTQEKNNFLKIKSLFTRRQLPFAWEIFKLVRCTHVPCSRRDTTY